ncbi:MAG: DUF998 domain-containing protein [Acidimicrobiales bacterium]
MAVSLGTAGILAYNWWVLVPVKPGLMRSPNELFSDLEATGQPLAGAMRSADFASGVLLVAAFVLLNTGVIDALRREWTAMVVFAIAGSVGAIFPESCADGVSDACRAAEIRFQLPVHHYVHIVAGIVEFGAITLALYSAVRRTRGSDSRFARLYRDLWRGALVAYPLLGLAYVTNDLGGIMEGVFFVGFTVMIGTAMAEWVAVGRARRPARLSPPVPSVPSTQTGARR